MTRSDASYFYQVHKVFTNCLRCAIKESHFRGTLTFECESEVAMAQGIQEGWLEVKFDEENDRVIIQTPNGDFVMTVRDFSIFCQKGDSLARWARNIKSIKEFMAQLLEKKRRKRPPVVEGDEMLAVREIEEILRQAARND